MTVNADFWCITALICEQKFYILGLPSDKRQHIVVGLWAKKRHAVLRDWGKRMSLEGREDRGKSGEVQKDLMALLTPRELQVLKLVAEGKSNKEIGWALKIGTDTVKLHVTHILQKLEVAGRTQAAVVYVQSGWNNRGGGPDAGGETGGEDERTKGA